MNGREHTNTFIVVPSENYLKTFRRVSSGVCGALYNVIDSIAASDLLLRCQALTAMGHSGILGQLLGSSGQAP